MAGARGGKGRGSDAGKECGRGGVWEVRSGEGAF